MNTRRTITTIAVVGALGLGGVACGGGSDEPSANFTAVGDAPTPAPISRQQAVRNALAEQGIPWSGTDAETDAAGEAVCTYFRTNGVNEASANELGQALAAKTGLSLYNAGYTLGVLIGAYCPELAPTSSGAYVNA